jgi:uncharacterized protein YjbI with pentapeptide repeats
VLKAPIRLTTASATDVSKPGRNRVIRAAPPLLRHTRRQLWCSPATLVRHPLTHANLADADLSGANLTDANLTRAYLTRANLRGANLSGANLTDANLTGANIFEADFAGVDLTDAQRQSTVSRDS